MGIVIDKLLQTTLLHSHTVDSFGSDPVSGKVGQIMLNTADHKIKIYYGNTWQELHELTPAAANAGEPIGLLLTLTYA